MSRARWARSVWARRGIFSFLQWLVAVPLSLLYGLAVRSRNACYRVGLLRSKRLERPVVSVGNLTVGGTGKTPTTIWLARELAKRGYKVAILSRGYKGDLKGAVVLDPMPEADQAGDRSEILAGDEAVMMARLFGQRVGVAKKS